MKKVFDQSAPHRRRREVLQQMVGVMVNLNGETSALVDLGGVGEREERPPH
jgi:hypothetical protein